jgi:hypothetical protein
MTSNATLPLTGSNDKDPLLIKNAHCKSKTINERKATIFAFHLFKFEYAAPASVGEKMTRSLDYGNLMHRAMRGLIKDVLTDVQANGLPGDHHFFITFDTQHEDVDIAEWLTQRYPEEMTVVMQHWYDNLNVTDDGFFITLNFGDQPEPLYIPYDAIITFVDPSVEFGLRFETHDSYDENDDDDIDDDDTPPEPKGAAEVVSLDKFRK